MSDRKKIAIGAMAELFRHKLSEASVRMFVAATAELTDDAFEKASAAAAQRSRYFPAPSELIELARTGGVAYEAQAALAFDLLDAALTQNTPSLLSPLVAAVARQIGGFPFLQAMPLGEFRTWKRKDFIATYVTLAKENPKRLAAMAGAGSELGAALAGSMRRIALSREEIALQESANRKRIGQAALRKIESKYSIRVNHQTIAETTQINKE